MHRVMVHPASYENCRVAITRIFELFPLEIKDKKVLVKPNVVLASSPDQGIVTHPALILAIVNKLEELGPSDIIVGDNPGLLGYGANEDTFRRSGLIEAAKGYYLNIGTKAVEVDLNPEFVSKVSVSSVVMDADIIISVPKFKTHGLTIITGAIKNSYGIIPGALKAKLHRLAGNALRFSELMVDVFRLRVPDLFIVDAVLGMEGNGPNCTDLRHIGQILASDNGVALDATIARMMGLNPSAVPFIEIARQRGLGSYSEDSIEIVGEQKPIPDFKLPPSVKKAKEKTTGDSFFFISRIRLRPRVDMELCIGCENCIEQCPVSALSMKDGLPEADTDRCITCFCCQEMCPEKAISLH